MLLVLEFDLSSERKVKSGFVFVRDPRVKLKHNSQHAHSPGLNHTVHVDSCHLLHIN